MKVHEWKAQENHHTQSKIDAFKENIRHQKILKSFEQCAQCHNKLFIHHNVFKDAQIVEEHVLCPHCNERAPIRAYRIH
jgi:uncharacterized CHY-type Zn-finger protein